MSQRFNTPRCHLTWAQNKYFQLSSPTHLSQSTAPKCLSCQRPQSPPPKRPSSPDPLYLRPTSAERRPERTDSAEWRPEQRTEDVQPEVATTALRGRPGSAPSSARPVIQPPRLVSFSDGNGAEQHTMNMGSRYAGDGYAGGGGYVAGGDGYAGGGEHYAGSDGDGRAGGDDGNGGADSSSAKGGTHSGGGGRGSGGTARQRPTSAGPVVMAKRRTGMFGPASLRRGTAPERREQQGIPSIAGKWTKDKQAAGTRNWPP